MSAEAILPASELLGRKAWVPEHVVYRDFVTETVVLNLETGEYHGVNRTGGLILAELERAETIGEAARTLAAEYGGVLAEVERDVCAFCTDLLARGLIRLHGDGDG
jgi:coenzyme PQQ synthesis protein D (PqqD)